jgi:hypothetical protein
VFGHMILQTRILLAAVLEKSRIAGSISRDIAEMLGKINVELHESIRPELWEDVD